MNLGAGLRAAAGHSMRAYYLPIVAGVGLAISAFMPWIFVDGAGVGGVPEVAALWILGLGVSAVVLASLSIVTRRNSRHPLLLVGLLSLGIMFLAYKLMTRAVAEQAWATAQARAIVEGTVPVALPDPTIGFGIYLGLVASIVLVLFGLTIVVRRVSQPYAPVDEDDDV